MSYNTKKTMFDNYLLEVAAKIGNPSRYETDDANESSLLTVHEQVAWSIDAYLKHGKHNQKTHGRRFGPDTGGGSGGGAGGGGGGGEKVRTRDALYDASQANSALQGYTMAQRDLVNAKFKAEAKLDRLPDGPKKTEAAAKIKSIYKEAEDKVRDVTPLVGKVKKALREANDEGDRDTSGIASPSLITNSRLARTGGEVIEKVSKDLSNSASRILDVLDDFL